MQTPIRPNLAGDISILRATHLLTNSADFILQPKYDGVRLLLHVQSRTAYTRNGKLFSPQIQQLFSGWPWPEDFEWIDGEILCALPSWPLDMPIYGALHQTLPLQTLIGYLSPKRTTPIPQHILERLHFFAFDCLLKNKPKMPYKSRQWEIYTNTYYFPKVKILSPFGTYDTAEEATCAQETLENICDHYEGIILRHSNSIYKHGRSSPKEKLPAVLKAKPLRDSEATIIAVRERMENLNPQELSPLGYTKRSSAQENLIPAGTLGAIDVEWHSPKGTVRFSLGTGWTDSEAARLFALRSTLPGTTLTFSYSGLTADGLPRCARYRSLRPADF